MIGLSFPLGYLFVLLILLNRYKHDRYDFIICLTLLFGGYALTDSSNFWVKPSDIGLLVSIVAVLVVRKNRLSKVVLSLLGVYFAGLVAIALTSDERMSVQILRLRVYMSIIYCFVPLLVFAGRTFDMDRFLRKTIVYSIILAIFYVLDGFVVNGFVFVPRSFNWGDSVSTFWHPIMNPFSTSFPRKYSPGLYIMMISVYAVSTRYSLRLWQWVVIGLSMVATRTMTFIAGLVVSYVTFQGNVLKTLRYVLFGVVALGAIYFVDRAAGGFMRVASTVDQFTSLEKAMDDEDLAEFGSGRMAQIIPKWELLVELDREWLGFGFLHPEKTTNPKYQVMNPYTVGGASRDYELATDVEVTQVQTIFDIGFVGLILQTLIYLMIYGIIRRLPYANLYVATLIAVSICGIGGGQAGLITYQGLFMTGLSLGCVLLTSRAEGADHNINVRSADGTRNL